MRKTLLLWIVPPEELDNGLLTLNIPLDKGLDSLMDKDTETDTDTVKDKSMIMDKDLEMEIDKAVEYLEKSNENFLYSSSHDPSAFDELIK